MPGRPTRYEVLLTRGAGQDLESIHDYILAFDSAARASHVLDRSMAVVDGLARFPEHSSDPRELSAPGIEACRQVAFEPCRVIYRVLGRQVVIYLIVDGRRDIRSPLARRLLGA